MILNNSKCIIGNSSSGLREGAYLGVPCVNIGSRQRGRERAKNVIDVDYNSDLIKDAIKYQVAHGKYDRSHLVGDGKAGLKIAKILANKGDAVIEGQTLMILEAMKMEHTILAPYTGTVSNVYYHEGDQVDENTELFEMVPAVEKK